MGYLETAGHEDFFPGHTFLSMRNDAEWESEIIEIRIMHLRYHKLK